MRHLFLMIVAGLMIILTSCSKSETADPTGGTPLKFNSLVAADTMIKINGVTTITANAEGEGLTYNWTATYGTFMGSGAQVQWTVCHKAAFIITCKVTDKYNKTESKQVVIKADY